MSVKVGRYVQAARLEQLRTMLETDRGVTYIDIANRFDIHRTSAVRHLAALRAGGQTVLEELDGKELRFRIPPSARRRSVTVTLRQVAAFLLARQETAFLSGTGLEADLEDLGKRLLLEFTDPTTHASRKLDRKLFTVPRGLPRYEGSAARMGEILDALLGDEEIEFTTEKPRKGRRTFRGKPLTLQTHRQLLYLVAQSEGHNNEIRTFGFHTIVNARRLAGRRFAYPEDYHPRSLVEGAFGIVQGKLESVRVRFTADVAPLVTRRVWHESQSLTYLPDGGVELRMRVRGMDDVREWVLGFADQAEVVAPRSLRADIARRARAMWQAHRMAAGSRRR